MMLNKKEGGAALLIPITRKELYLNKIVGNNEYETPEKPISEEEFFFAAILGEAVQAPEPLTRYQIYLAKIAGKNIEIPYPKTRLELFLAKACGMEIETPTPITREEMLWADYALIVEKELSGIPPLTFNAVAGTLKNYRIYGNTVNGENVGDLITEGEHAGEYSVPVTVEGKNLINPSKNEIRNTGVEYTVNNDMSITANGSTSSIFSLFLVKVYLTKGSYIISGCPQNGSQNTYRCEIRNMELSSLIQDTGTGVTYSIVTDGYYYYSIRIAQNYVCDNLTFYPMIRKADIEDDTYEPYHAPVTTPIYLPEQLRMVGTEADYIDYGEQKQHFADGTSVDVTLPALPTLSGTNTLTVGTEVQPSNVYIKHKGAR